MVTTIRRARWTLLLLPLALACGKQDAPAADSLAGASASAVRPAAAASNCPRTGHWSECQVFKRLDMAGVAPRRNGTPGDLPNMAVKPIIYGVGNTALAVYLFPDSVARARAASRLDTLHYLPASKSLTMRGETTVIENDNLLGLLFSRIDQQRERVSDALMGGAPR